MSETQIAEPQIETPEAPAAPSAPAEPQPVSLADDALVEVKVNGELQRLPWKEAREQVMLHRDYTRKTQEVAAQRREFESKMAEFTKEREAITQQQQTLQSILQDPSRLGLLIAAQQAARSKQSAEPQPLTTAHVSDLQKALLEQVGQTVEQRFAAFQRQKEQETVESDLSAYIKSSLGDHPILQIAPGIEDVIFGHAEKSLAATGIDLQRLPMTERLALAKQHLQQAADAVKERWSAQVGEQAKSTAVTKGKAIKGIEPKGGKGVLPTAPEFKDMSDVERAFTEFLNQQDAARA